MFVIDNVTTTCYPKNHIVFLQAETEAKVETDGYGQEADDMFVVSLPLPSGYKSEVDSSSGQMCYINIHTGARVSKDVLHFIYGIPRVLPQPCSLRTYTLGTCSWD